MNFIQNLVMFEAEVSFTCYQGMDTEGEETPRFREFTEARRTALSSYLYSTSLRAYWQHCSCIHQIFIIQLTTQATQVLRIQW